MWEDATPLPPQEQQQHQDAPAGQNRPTGSSDNLVLWAQLFLCGLVLAGILAARSLQLPIFAELRIAYTAALQADSGLLGEERSFVHFAQETLAALGQAAQQALDRLAPQTTQPQDEPDGDQTAGFTAVAAGRVRAKPAPAGSSLQSYLPGFPFTDPLGGGYRTTSSYGWRTDPMTGAKQTFHTGTDLAVAEGTPVRAAAAGIVRRAGYSQSYGNYARILHADGDETLYAHLQYLFVHGGQSVAMGEQIGTVGQTGNATGAHLHFELLHQGGRYDPQKALEAAL